MIKYELISFLQYLITYFQFYSSITNLNNYLLIISLILFGTQYLKKDLLCVFEVG